MHVKINDLICRDSHNNGFLHMEQKFPMSKRTSIMHI